MAMGFSPGKNPTVFSLLFLMCVCYIKFWNCNAKIGTCKNPTVFSLLFLMCVCYIKFWNCNAKICTCKNPTVLQANTANAKSSTTNWTGTLLIIFGLLHNKLVGPVGCGCREQARPVGCFGRREILSSNPSETSHRHKNKSTQFHVISPREI
jgi:hypothetical protein